MINKVPFTGAGYLNVGELLPNVLPYTWIWGGRGTGKTFGFLQDVRVTNPRRFVLMRRTQKQIDMLQNQLFNPFKPVDEYHGLTTICKKNKEVGVFYNGEQRGDDVLPYGEPLGYAVALSAIHNIRGFDLSDAEIIIFDEFCPEVHERPIKNEYLAFLNAMETIGRNRELQGRPPIQFIGLSNSNSLGNPYFVGLQIIRVVDRMLKKKTEIWANESRGLMLVNITASPISAAKANTSLYKLAGAGEFAEMSLGNQFAQDICSRPGTVPLPECRPLVSVGELTFYEHKTKRVIYCCDHLSGNPERYETDETSLKRFKRDYGWYLYDEYLANNIIFQDILCEILFKHYC